MSSSYEAEATLATAAYLPSAAAAGSLDVDVQNTPDPPTMGLKSLELLLEFESLAPVLRRVVYALKVCARMARGYFTSLSLGTTGSSVSNLPDEPELFRRWAAAALDVATASDR